MNPKISVIIPIYNAELYLRRCMESVLNQSYTDWQLILVDDGSKDKSYEICKEYADRDNRIKLIHQQNAGAGAARNSGISAAVGDYIVFIDADDYIDREYFKLLSEHDEDIVFIDVEAVDTRGKVIRREYMSSFKELSKDDFMRSQMTGKINWGGVRKVVKRHILESYNVRYSSHKVGEEALFTYNSVFYSNTIGFIESPVYFYVQHVDSLSHVVMDDPWGDVALALKKETIRNGSYSSYADTINAFILVSAAVSADRLVINYSAIDYYKKISELYNRLSTTLDSQYSIDFKHMSNKALFLGKLLLGRHFKLIRVICKSKNLIFK